MIAIILHALYCDMMSTVLCRIERGLTGVKRWIHLQDAVVNEGRGQNDVATHHPTFCPCYNAHSDTDPDDDEEIAEPFPAWTQFEPPEEAHRRETTERGAYQTNNTEYISFDHCPDCLGRVEVDSAAGAEPGHEWMT